MTAPAGGPGRTCPFCALRYQGSPNACPRCGTLLGAASEDLRRLGARERTLLRTQRALADTLFLVGLLLGGPLITLGGRLELGLLVVLAGALASALRRYSSWSLPGILAVATLGALVVAAVVIEPAQHAVEETRAGEEARRAYVDALDRRDEDVHVHTGGPAALAVWFTFPHGGVVECGAYPPAEVRDHLAELGFARVVVTARSEAGGLCSFSP